MPVGVVVEVSLPPTFGLASSGASWQAAGVVGDFEDLRIWPVLTLWFALVKANGVVCKGMLGAVHCSTTGVVTVYFMSRVVSSLLIALLDC